MWTWFLRGTTKPRPCGLGTEEDDGDIRHSGDQVEIEVEVERRVSETRLETQRPVRRTGRMVGRGNEAGTGTGTDNIRVGIAITRQRDCF